MQIFYSVAEYKRYAKMFFTFKISQYKMIHNLCYILFANLRREESSLFRFSRDSQVQIHYIHLNQDRQYMLQMRISINLRL